MRHTHTHTRYIVSGIAACRNLTASNKNKKIPCKARRWEEKAKAPCMRLERARAVEHAAPRLVAVGDPRASHFLKKRNLHSLRPLTRSYPRHVSIHSQRPAHSEPNALGEHRVEVVHLLDLDTEAQRVDTRLDEAALALIPANGDGVQQQLLVTPAAGQSREAAKHQSQLMPRALEDHTERAE
jgi:hypothetical protein